MLGEQRQTVPGIRQHHAFIGLDCFERNHFEKSISGMDFEMRCARFEPPLREQVLETDAGPAWRALIKSPAHGIRNAAESDKLVEEARNAAVHTASQASRCSTRAGDVQTPLLFVDDWRDRVDVNAVVPFQWREFRPRAGHRLHCGISVGQWMESQTMVVLPLQPASSFDVSLANSPTAAPTTVMAAVLVPKRTRSVTTINSLNRSNRFATFLHSSGTGFPDESPPCPAQHQTPNREERHKPECIDGRRHGGRFAYYVADNRDGHAQRQPKDDAEPNRITPAQDSDDSGKDQTHHDSGRDKETDDRH